MTKINNKAQVAKNSNESAQEKTNKYEDYANLLTKNGMDSGNAHFIAYLMEQQDLANDYQHSLENEHPANQGNRKVFERKAYSRCYLNVLCQIFRKLPKTKREDVNIVIGAILSLTERQVNVAGQNLDLVAEYIKEEVEDTIERHLANERK